MELTWLPNHLLKGVQLPKVTYVEDMGQEYGGYYTHGSNELVVVCYNDELIPATIAHEFCHHLQWQNGDVMGGSVWSAGNNYEDSIKSFFRSYSWEMEALLFEHKYTKNWLNDWWLNKLVKE